MAFLGQDPVRRKIFVDKKRLQVKILNISTVKITVKINKIFNKTRKICSNTRNFRQYF